MLDLEVAAEMELILILERSRVKNRAGTLCVGDGFLMGVRGVGGCRLRYWWSEEEEEKAVGVA